MPGVNFKNFKAVGQDEHSYTVKHPNGKTLFIEKSKLSPEAHKAILHLYQGGVSDGAGDSTDSSAEQPGIFQRVYNGINDALSSDEEIRHDKSMAGLAKLSAATLGDSMPFPRPDPNEVQPDRPNGFTRTGPMLSAKDMAAMKAIKESEGPVSGDSDFQQSGPTEAQAVAKLQGRAPDSAVPSSDPLIQNKNDQQSLLQQQIQQQQEALGAGQAGGQDIANIQQGEAASLAKLPSFNDIVAKYQANDAKLAQDYSDSKIDPNHLTHSMSTGSKVLTAVGMVLSGLGSGMTGQKPYAMDVLNDAIKRDVDDQANDQSKKMNLWKMNREALGNETAANLATENQIKAGALAQLQAAQTRAQLPQEKLRAQMAINQLQQEMLQNNLRRGLLTQGMQGAQANGSGALSSADPSTLVPEMVKDPAQQKAVYEEIKNRQNITKNGAAMLKAFDQAANEVSGVGGVLHSAIEKTPGQMALDQLMKPNMSELDGTIRREAVAGAQETMIPSYKDLGRPDRIASKRQSLIDWMKSQQSAPVSKGNYIDLDRFQNTALPNMAAPIKPQTQIMHGHTYQKVQGGWKLVK